MSYIFESSVFANPGLMLKLIFQLQLYCIEL